MDHVDFAAFTSPLASQSAAIMVKKADFAIDEHVLDVASGSGEFAFTNYNVATQPQCGTTVVTLQDYGNVLKQKKKKRSCKGD